MHCRTRQPAKSYLQVCLIIAIHLESERRSKNDTEEDVVLSEEEAKMKTPLAIFSSLAIELRPVWSVWEFIG
jgi:hypothetical protein